MSIPTQDKFTLIFNKDMSVTEQTYKQDQDALRVDITPAPGTEKTESFTIDFSDVTDSTANMNFKWDEAKATANLAVDVNKNAAANVDKAVSDKPEDAAVLQAAASYNLSKGRNLDQALTWIDKSIAQKETYRNLFVKSQILGKQGKYAEALPVAQKALTMGQSSNDAAFPFFKDGIEKSISEYNSKMPAPATKKGKKKA
jgi:tetratricopeptide (TPR) repeat protein